VYTSQQTKCTPTKRRDPVGCRSFDGAPIGSLLRSKRSPAMAAKCNDFAGRHSTPVRIGMLQNLKKLADFQGPGQSIWKPANLDGDPSVG
jgi:hypothetical protein